MYHEKYFRNHLTTPENRDLIDAKLETRQTTLVSNVQAPLGLFKIKEEKQMGSVTATVSNAVNDVFQTQSIHFESYEDFVKYENAAAGQPAQPENNVHLTDSQIYKLRILLGHVLGDKDCAELNEQLDIMFDDELECEDYDKLYFTVILDDLPVVLEDGEKDATIQFK